LNTEIESPNTNLSFGSCTGSLRTSSARPVDTGLKGTLARKHKRKLTKNYVYIAVFIVFILWKIYEKRRPLQIVISCEKNQPLVEIRDNAFPDPEFDHLIKSLENHSRLNNLSAVLLPGEYFQTYGIVARFSEHGSKFLNEDPSFKDFAWLLDKVRIPEANAFCFNIIVREGNETSQYATESHVHEGLSINLGKKTKRFIAHQVDILYIRAPSDVLEGGILELLPWNATQVPDAGAEVQVVLPKQNRLVTVRGDAYHRFRSFHPKSEPFYSVEIEQYKLSSSSLVKKLSLYRPDRRRGVEILEKII